MFASGNQGKEQPEASNFNQMLQDMHARCRLRGSHSESCFQASFEELDQERWAQAQGAEPS